MRQARIRNRCSVIVSASSPPGRLQIRLAKEISMPAPDANAALPRDPEADLRWASLLARDRSADGTFFYAVRTTGVFCHPSCPSRRPKQENVVFFASGTEAEAAGYRACLRCRPPAMAGHAPPGG